jgi:hypothetical protein
MCCKLSFETNGDARRKGYSYFSINPKLSKKKSGCVNMR